jgi:hypothetical protein
VDVKIPLFPTATPEEGFRLLQALCKKRGLALEDVLLKQLRDRLPLWLTPGAAEALAVKLYRQVRTTGQNAGLALADCLQDYQMPVPRAVLEQQIELARQEASDLEFIPPAFRQK